MDKFDLLFKLNRLAFSTTSIFFNVLRLNKYHNIKKELNKNENLKAMKNSDRCYICGLGPSLKDVDLSKIKDDTIVVNNFAKFGEKIDFSPSIYLAVDGAFADDNHFPKIKNALKMYPNSTFVLSEKIVNKVKNENIDKEIYTIYGGNKLFSRDSKIDFTKQYPIGLNVLSEAIMLAIYIGYKEIYLLGADFNSFAEQKAVHCYVETDNTRKIRLWKELFCYSFMADVHDELKCYSDNNSVKIINATPNSLIDAYVGADNLANAYYNKQGECNV